MFRALIKILAIFAFSVDAMANGYCDTRQTQADVSRCYKDNIDLRNNLIQGTLNKIMTSTKIPYAEKKSVKKNHVLWESQVNSQCKSQACVENSLIQRNAQLDAYLRKFNQ